MTLFTIPDVLKDKKQFVSSYRKVPCDPVTKFPINGLDPANWVTGDKAYRRAAFLCNGINCSFAITNGYFLIDLDHCIVDGVLLTTPSTICDLFADCYQEISQSGKALHIIGKLDKEYSHKSKNKDGSIEFYTKNKIVLITGNIFKGRNNIDHVVCDSLIEEFINRYHLEKQSDEVDQRWTETACNDCSTPSSDDALIAYAMTNDNFLKLWKGDNSFITDNYSDDKSSADAALASHLAFWTGRNCERMERLFSRSALGQRDKWKDRKDYRERTILNACAQCVKVVQHKKGDIPKYDSKSISYVDYMEDMNADGRFATIDMQKELFKHCVYLWKSGLIFDASQYTCLDKEAFNGLYNHYLFALDWDGEKTTKSAYEAFRESKAYRPPMAEDVVYEPKEQFGAMLTGLKYSGFPNTKFVNAFVLPEVARKCGDATQFDIFMSKLFPDSLDKKTILSYMASVVQNKGVKMRWCPVIQGVQGNGKTTIMRIVEQAIGHQISVVHTARKMFDDKFNGYLEGKLFVGIDELKKIHYREHSDELNDLVTNHRMHIRKMRCDPVQRNNHINFMICTNYKDAIEINEDTRRWCIFYTAQQEHDDLIRDGLTKDYFVDFNEWLEKDGFAIITDYLERYEIEEEYNPVHHSRAPVTSSSAAARVDSLCPTVQKIKEAIDEELPGFKNGFISSYAVSIVLGYKVYNWRDISAGLKKLGYVKVIKRTRELPLIGYAPSMPNSPYSMGSRVKHSLWCLDSMNSEDVSTLFETSQK